jgi:glucose-6-phosphate isomerase
MSTHKIPEHVSASCWQALVDHRETIARTSLKEMFVQNPGRAKDFSAEISKLYIDYSKHFITEETTQLLIAMALSTDLRGAIQKLFSGATINRTENNAAMHMALRAPADKACLIDGENVTRQVHDELQHMQDFVTSLHNGEIRGHSDKPIETVINIGIGGSDLGPKLATEALSNFAVSDIDIHFVSNVDINDINSALQKSDPETTLFIISSKSFTTKETLLNAKTAMKWLKINGCQALEKHLLAVTANHHAAKTFGIKDENIFHIWKWVGGRYSLWSAIGLPIAIRIGMDNFRDFLSGAASMDQHFCEQTLENNLPVILALIDIWYINFFHAETIAIFPYDHSMKTFPAYIGQLFMESNGKQIDNEGIHIKYNTSPVIWGGTGNNAQHAYFQCLHQGTLLVPVDFIVSLKSTSENKSHHQELLANCLAQSETLLNGQKNTDQAETGHKAYKNIPGNRPSTTILLDELSPATLGSLLCLYEHRCFVQAHIWNINPFDQWGVELGKNLAKIISEELRGNTDKNVIHDSSTERLISYCRNKSESL